MTKLSSEIEIYWDGEELFNDLQLKYSLCKPQKTFHSVFSAMTNRENFHPAWKLFMKMTKWNAF